MILRIPDGVPTEEELLSSDGSFSFSASVQEVIKSGVQSKWAS